MPKSIKNHATIESLIAKLDTQSDSTAAKIIVKLAIIGKKALPFLIETSADKNSPRIRKWSLQALGAIADSETLPILIKALKDPQMTIRLQALKGLRVMLGKSTTPNKDSVTTQKAVRAIANLLADDSGGIRVNALYALTEFGDSSVKQKIIKCLDDPQWYVRQNACIACGKLNFSNALPQLNLLAIDDQRKAVRNAAVNAIKLLQPIESEDSKDSKE